MANSDADAHADPWAVTHCDLDAVAHAYIVTFIRNFAYCHANSHAHPVLHTDLHTHTHAGADAYTLAYLDTTSYRGFG